MLIPCGFVAAQAVDINGAIASGDLQSVRGAIEASSGETRTSVEASVLAAAKKAVLEDDLDRALGLLEQILLVDLDNVDAQDLYTSVEASKQEKADRAARKKAEEDKKAAADQKKAEDEKIAAERAEADRLAREKAEKEKADQEAFIRSVRHIDIGNFAFSLALSPADFLLYSSEFADSYRGSSSRRLDWGCSGSALVRFSHPYIGSAISLEYEINPVALGAADIHSAFNAHVSVGTPALGFPLYLLGGYQRYGFEGADGASADTVLFTELSGPTLGIAVEEWRIGSRFDFSLDVEWLGASLSDDLIDLGLTAGGSARFKFKEMRSSVRPYLELRAREYYISAGGDSEKSFSGSILAGVLINEYK